jgi:hypothetical protein
MKRFVLPDGTIKMANAILAKELLRRGARELKLNEIKTPNINEYIETRGSVGTGKVPKSARSGKPRSGKRQISRKLD